MLKHQNVYLQTNHARENIFHWHWRFVRAMRCAWKYKTNTFQLHSKQYMNFMNKCESMRIILGLKKCIFSSMAWNKSLLHSFKTNSIGIQWLKIRKHITLFMKLEACIIRRFWTSSILQCQIEIPIIILIDSKYSLVSQSFPLN